MASFLSYGFGTIGQSIAKVLEDNGHRIVAAVDPAPEYVGKHLKDYGFKSSGPILAQARRWDVGDADLAIHATVSDLATAASQLEDLLLLGLPVVSTCEELAYPEDSAEYESLSKIADRKKVPLVAAGVNPGFVMDVLPLYLFTGLQERPNWVGITRSVDATQRRKQFQDKIGIGLTEDQFEQGLKDLALGHRGLSASARLLARRLGMTFHLDPKETIVPDFKDGIVRGVSQRVQVEGFGPVLDLTFRAGAGYENQDRYHCVMRDGGVFEATTSGYHGDRATAAQVASVALGLLRDGAHLRGLLLPDEVPRALVWAQDIPR